MSSPMMSILLGGDFIDFWRLSTHRVGKKAAFAAYIKARDRASKEKIHQAYELYGIETSGRLSRYVLHPATWLNGDRWNDEPDPHPAVKPYDRIAAARAALVRAALSGSGDEEGDCGVPRHGDSRLWTTRIVGP